MKQAKLFCAIEEGNMNAFMDIFNSFNHINVHQLIFSCDRFGYSLIH